MTTTCVPSQEKKRASCACGGRNSVMVTFRYLDYETGEERSITGRFCYFLNAVIGMEIAADAIPVQMIIADLHEMGEIITIEFSHPKTPNESQEGDIIPGLAGDDERDIVRHGAAGLVNTPRLPLPKLLPGNMLNAAVRAEK